MKEIHEPIAKLRTLSLEVENRCNRVTTYRAVIDHVLNSVNRVLNRLIPLIREYEILLSPAIGRLTRDSRTLLPTTRVSSFLFFYSKLRNLASDWGFAIATPMYLSAPP